MVMVRLNHVTTEYDPLHDRVRADMPTAHSSPVTMSAGSFLASRSAIQNGLGQLKSPGDKVLDDLSLTVLSGETLSVVGPSGCGKSTLLRVIAGLIHPDVGEVYFDGLPMNGRSPRERHIGMVFQNYALYPHMAAQENIGFFWRLRRHRTEEISERVRQTAALMEIDAATLLGRLPRHLSGGEQQRVAVGRCLSRDPSVFLLDEPFSNLDAHLRERSRRQVKKLLMRFAVTTIFVTHDQQEATAMGNRLAVMRQGKIVQVGTYRELFEDPHDSFVAGFLGDPPINLFPCHFNEAAGVLTNGRFLEVSLHGPTKQLVDGQKLILGVRPDDIRLTPSEEVGAMRGHISHFEPRIADRSKIVYIDIVAHLVAANVPYDTPIAAGDPVGMRFAPGGFLLFDVQTHRRLPLPYQARA